MTSYHVLFLDRSETKDAAGVSPEAWDVYARDVEAHSADDAIKKSASADGMYVAVPSRSFTPTNVKIETTTTVKVSATTG